MNVDYGLQDYRNLSNQQSVIGNHSSNMLPKSQRLNLKKDFKFVADGKKSYTQSFKLFYRLGENDHPLVGVAVSKTYFKKAHERNKAKRVSFQAIGNCYPQLLKNLNLVIMPNDKVLERTADQLTSELEHAKDLYQSH